MIRFNRLELSELTEEALRANGVPSLFWEPARRAYMQLRGKHPTVELQDPNELRQTFRFLYRFALFGAQSRLTEQALDFAPISVAAALRSVMSPTPSPQLDEALRPYSGAAKEFMRRVLSTVPPERWASVMKELEDVAKSFGSADNS